MGNMLYSLQKVCSWAWLENLQREMSNHIPKPPHLALINTKERQLFRERLPDVREHLTTVTLPRISVISHFLCHTFRGSWPLVRFGTEIIWCLSAPSSLTVWSTLQGMLHQTTVHLMLHFPISHEQDPSSTWGSRSPLTWWQCSRFTLHNGSFWVWLLKL